MKTTRPTFEVTLGPEPDVDPDRALRAGLKYLLRSYGLRCTGLREVPPAETRSCQRAAMPWLPGSRPQPASSAVERRVKPPFRRNARMGSTVKALVRERELERAFDRLGSLVEREDWLRAFDRGPVRDRGLVRSLNLWYFDRAS